MPRLLLKPGFDYAFKRKRSIMNTIDILTVGVAILGIVFIWPVFFGITGWFLDRSLKGKNNDPDGIFARQAARLSRQDQCND